jgi:phage-related protein
MRPRSANGRISPIRYNAPSARKAKPVVWLHGKVSTPPFSVEARREAGFLLRMLQEGEALGMPRSRPMPSIGPGCHELRIPDERHSWRLIYSITPEAILVLAVFAKTTQATPGHIIEFARQALGRFREDLKP